MNYQVQGIGPFVMRKMMLPSNHNKGRFSSLFEDVLLKNFHVHFRYLSL